MKKLLGAIALLLGFYNTSPAQAHTDTLAHTLLWKISGNGLKDTSYLYGTMHSGDDRVFTLPDSALIAFDRVKSFAMEINMDSVDKTGMAQMMMMNDGETIESLLGDADYKLAKKYFSKRTGYPLFLFNRIKPVFVFAMMQEGKQKKKDDVLDMFYFKLAKKQNKPITGLEKAEDQMKLLDGLPIEKQIDLLREGLHNFTAFQKEMDQGTDAYATGNLNKLLEETQSDTSMSGNFMEDFIDKRNRVMVNGMTRIMHSGSSLFTAVGAAHLPGENGIINLLKKEGYTVSPVISTKFLKPKEVRKRLR